jgi:hypothetical protein
MITLTHGEGNLLESIDARSTIIFIPITTRIEVVSVEVDVELGPVYDSDLTVTLSILRKLIWNIRNSLLAYL